ncbi:GNAT family N-acetyltransferase [Haladaptatus sp. GCM10025707]|uniref:GNAT family N-acetyltransferase n=1 Tax=unclassified Haladaptatus TaxID=2622732 RepID=UPI0023E8252A|nr:GNAT family N-acetyltransferase [Haladaptatus sp. QDMS2]
MALVTHTAYVNGVTIRLSTDGDRDAICALVEESLSAPATPDWFDWKYLDNPFADDFSLLVAEVDGTVIGMQGYLSFPLAHGIESLAGAMLVDAIIHPDYRGTGIYSKLAKETISHGEATHDVLFSFLNDAAAPIFDHWGWIRVAPTKTHSRIQDPGAFVRPLGPIATVTTALARFLRRRRDRRVTLGEKLAIEQADGVFIDDLVVLSRRVTPSRLHLRRDERFLAWRFGNPQDEWTTYTATRYGVPLASVVTRIKMVGDKRVVTLAEVAPLEGDADRTIGLRRILLHLCEEHADATLLQVPDGLLPEAVLAEFGFKRDESRLRRLVVGGPEYTLYVHSTKPLPVNVFEPANWLLPSAAQTTS